MKEVTFKMGKGFTKSSDFHPIRVHYILRRLAAGQKLSRDLIGDNRDLMPATQSVLRRLLQSGAVVRIRQPRQAGFGIEYLYGITTRGTRRLAYLDDKFGKK